MPTYVYRRQDGSTFEVFQKITEDALTVDPETGQKVERVITGSAGLIFKGSGFYLTDYARKNGGGEPKPSTDPGEKSKTPAADTKPAPSKPETSKE